MPASHLRTVGLLSAGALIALAAAGATVFFRPFARQESAAKPDTRATQREEKGVKFKRAEDAQERGIEAEPARPVQWHPRLSVDGRVLANPQATLEVRAPFAGVLRLDASDSSWRLGAPVQAQETLANLEARFSPAERLDLKTKLAEAEARCQSAEEVLKIRQERIARLGLIPSGILVRDETDSASVQLSEARMQKNIALAQFNIWKNALESVAKTSIIVPIVSPIAGEISELGAQPGANVDAGQVIARIVDFRRVLVRLDFPLQRAGAAPPAIDVETPGSIHEPATRWRASLRGMAPQIESGLQKASYLYEIVLADGASPRWRPGLYVTATLDNATKASQPAVAIPAAALLIHQGRTLVYIQKRVGRYERREVQLLGRDGDTLYVNVFDGVSGLRGDDAVVTKHAQALLSEEFRNEADDD